MRILRSALLATFVLLAALMWGCGDTVTRLIFSALPDSLIDIPDLPRHGHGHDKPDSARGHGPRDST